MRKKIVATAVAVMMLAVSLAPNKAQAHGYQYGVVLGYGSVGFQLHGASAEILLGTGGRDKNRPVGSVIHVGLAGMFGQSTSNLLKAKWNGGSYADFAATEPDRIRAASVTATRQVYGEELLEAIQARVTLGTAEVSRISGESATAGDVAAAAITDAPGAYGITDYRKVKHDGVALVVSFAYEYVFADKAPGLGILAGAELYVPRGGFKSADTRFPDVRIRDGLGGGAVLGIGYYTRNGINFSFKTGLGGINPGEVVFLDATVNLKPVFYATPTFSIGAIY